MTLSAEQLSGPPVYYLVDSDLTVDVGDAQRIVMEPVWLPDFNAGLYLHKGRVCGQGVISPTTEHEDFAPHEQVETIVAAGGIPAVLRPADTVMLPLYTDQQNSDDAYCGFTWFPSYIHPDGSWTTGTRASEPTVVAQFPPPALVLDTIRYDVAPAADSPPAIDFIPFAENDGANVQWVAGGDGLTIASHPGRIHMDGSVTPVTALEARDAQAWIQRLTDNVDRPPNTAPLNTLHNLVVPWIGGGSLLEGADSYHMIHCFDDDLGLVLQTDERMRQRAVYRSAWPDTDDGPAFIGTLTESATPVVPGDVTRRGQRFPFGGPTEVYRITATVTITDPVVGTQGGFFFADNIGRFWLFVLRCVSLDAPPASALEIVTMTFDGAILTARTSGGAFTLPLGTPRVRTVEISLDFRPVPILSRIDTIATGTIPGSLLETGGPGDPQPISLILDDGTGNWGLYKGDPGGRAIDSVVTIGDVIANRMDPALPFPTDQDFNNLIEGFPPNQALNFADVGWRYIDGGSSIVAGPPLEAQARLHEHFVGNTHLR